MTRDGWDRPAIPSPDAPSLAAFFPVIDALGEVSTIREQSGRRQLTELIEDELGRQLMVPDHGVLRQTLISIVDACRKLPGGIPALANALTLLEPDSFSVQEVLRRLGDVGVLSAVPDLERDALRGLLAGIEAPGVLEAYLGAAGASVRALGPHSASAWDAYVDLEAVNAGPDGLPPCLVFVERIAAQIDSRQAESLRAWNDRQVRRLELTHALLDIRQTLASRTVTSATKAAYLIIQLARHGREPGRYLLSHWKQLDPRGWYPQRGEDRVVTLAEIERRVEDLVTAAEIEWAQFDGQIIVEFVLPRELLNLPVEQWVMDSDTDFPTPLGIRYPIVIRSLERMRRKDWHRLWRQRWKYLRGAQRDTEAYWIEPNADRHISRLEAKLMSDVGVVSLVLSAPPQTGPSSRVDEMLVALRAGVPVVIWHREDCSLPVFRQHVDQLMSGGLTDLPERLMSLRLLGVEGSAVAPEQVAVLMDDPERLLETDESPGIAS